MSLTNRELLEMIWGDQVGNVVVGIMDQAGPKGQLNRSWDFSWPSQADDVVNFFNTHQNEDAYFSPLIYGEMRDEKTERLRRVPENAISSLVVYQDSDACPPEAFKLRPSVHINTSPGRGQDYWVLDEPVPATTAAYMSRQIAVAHKADGSDPSSWSANKFMRAITTNTRHGFPAKITGEAWGDVYAESAINDAYGNVDTSVNRPIARLIDHYSDSDEDLPDFAESFDLVPPAEVERLGLNKLVFEPYDEGRRSETRYRLLCQLFRVQPPLEFERILAIAWHAPAASKWREDPRNVRGLIMEAQKAQTEVGYETGDAVSGPQKGENLFDLPEVQRPDIKLLNDAERALVANEDNFIRKYERWSLDKLGPAHNGPYARMNAWTVLSFAFSDLGVIPSTGDSLNLYAIGIGDSGSGKSSSHKLMRRCMDEVTEQCHNADDGWWIGQGASPQAMHEALLERDQKTTIFMADEAHGWFKTVNNQQWADGIYEAIALYYDGTVPPIHKTTKRDLSGKSAVTYFGTHLMGTMKGDMSITNVLNRSMFFSGLMPRFTWYISDPRVVTRESMEESNGDGEYVNSGHERMAQQWAAEFANTRKQMRAKARLRRIPMNMTQEALDRLTVVKWAARELAIKRGEWDILEPCMIRLGPNIRRCASLLAIADGRSEVNLTDLLVAVEQAEEWLANLFAMAELVSASQWARDVQDIEDFVLGKGGKVLFEVAMRQFKGRRPRDLMEQIGSLQTQGRVREAAEGGKKYLVANTGGG